MNMLEVIVYSLVAMFSGLGLLVFVDLLLDVWDRLN